MMWLLQELPFVPMQRSWRVSEHTLQTASSLERLHIDMYQLIDDYMEQRKFSRAATAAFTGHRFIDASQKEHVKKLLSNAVLDAYGHGIRNFISGFAIGFDMMAAEEVVSLKQTYPDITLTAAVPFKGQACRFNFYDRKRYDRLLEMADEVIVLSESYYPRCFLERDVFMVKNSSLLIANYDGRRKGGTFYTIERAKEQSIPVVNVFDNS